MSEHKFGMDKKRGPYGTNVGDMRLSPGSEMQRSLDASDKRDMEGNRLALVIEIRDYGDGPEETVFVTGDIKMVADAAEGYLRWTQDQEKLGQLVSVNDLQYASDWIKAASEEGGW